MAKKFPVDPPHPERTCWGCDRYCAANSLLCGNGSERTQHPAELFGADWQSWGPRPVDVDARPVADGGIDSALVATVHAG